MARVSIRPIEPLEMEFLDGTVKEALFNNEAFILYTEEFGTIDATIENELISRPYDFVSKVLYCGMKVMDRTVTLDEAKSILIGGGDQLTGTILSLLVDNFMSVADENSKKKFLETIQNFNKRMLG